MALTYELSAGDTGSSAWAQPLRHRTSGRRTHRSRTGFSGHTRPRREARAPTHDGSGCGRRRRERDLCRSCVTRASVGRSSLNRIAASLAYRGLTSRSPIPVGERSDRDVASGLADPIPTLFAVGRTKDQLVSIPVEGKSRSSRSRWRARRGLAAAANCLRRADGAAAPPQVAADRTSPSNRPPLVLRDASWGRCLLAQLSELRRSWCH